jgi:hypothetical protein
MLVDWSGSGSKDGRQDVGVSFKFKYKFKFKLEVGDASVGLSSSDSTC